MITWLAQVAQDKQDLDEAGMSWKDLAPLAAGIGSVISAFIAGLVLVANLDTSCA